MNAAKKGEIATLLQNRFWNDRKTAWWGISSSSEGILSHLQNIIYVNLHLLSPSAAEVSIAPKAFGSTPANAISHIRSRATIIIIVVVVVIATAV